MQTPGLMPLLLVSMGLVKAVQAQHLAVTRRDLFSQETPLDMAPASFDDQYAGCSAAMTAALAELNRTEFQTNQVYADGWAMASGQWRERRAWGPEWGLSPPRPPPAPPGFREEHGVALLAYTANTPLHREFNAAVRQAGRSRAHYLQHFRFKALHFLLTDALRLLRGAPAAGCRQVFRGVHGLRFRPAGPGATVRLGGFASASLQNVAAQQFGQDTFFGIWTCLGAPIGGYSFFPGEEEVLIPPFETFQVVNASRPPHGPARIYLRALGTRSTYNCEYIRDKECRSGRCHLDNSATGQGSLSLVWSLLLLLWFLEWAPFQEVQTPDLPHGRAHLPSVPHTRTLATASDPSALGLCQLHIAELWSLLRWLPGFAGGDRGDHSVLSFS